MKNNCLMSGLLVLAAAGLCLGATNIDPVLKLVWGENIGWLNWRDANGGAAGVFVSSRILSGSIWGENVGYINVGNGSPVNGISYGNVDGSDFGVNIDPVTENLYGLGWGENIGWINFDTRAALGVSGQQARFDTVSLRFRGYAWGENVGWINLDNGTAFVAAAFAGADFNRDGYVDNTDLSIFEACATGPAIPYNPALLPALPPGCLLTPDVQGHIAADFNKDGDVDQEDFAVFQRCWSGAVAANPNCTN